MAVGSRNTLGGRPGWGLKVTHRRSKVCSWLPWWWHESSSRYCSNACAEVCKGRRRERVKMKLCAHALCIFTQFQEKYQLNCGCSFRWTWRLQQFLKNDVISSTGPRSLKGSIRRHTDAINDYRNCKNGSRNKSRKRYWAAPAGLSGLMDKQMRAQIQSEWLKAFEKAWRSHYVSTRHETSSGESFSAPLTHLVQLWCYKRTNQAPMKPQFSRNYTNVKKLMLKDTQLKLMCIIYQHAAKITAWSLHLH